MQPGSHRRDSAAGWWLRDEKPVRIPEFDEPEPDVSVVRGSRQDYRTRHPGPGDIEFLVEVGHLPALGPWRKAFGLRPSRRADLLDLQPGRPPTRGFDSPDCSGYCAVRFSGRAIALRLPLKVAKSARSTWPTCSLDLRTAHLFVVSRSVKARPSAPTDQLCKKSSPSPL